MSVIICMAALLATTSSIASPVEKKAVLKISSDFADAWGKRDAHALAGLFTEDADFLNPMGRARRLAGRRSRSCSPTSNSATHGV